MSDLAFSIIEMWIGFYLLMAIISYAILTSGNKTTPKIKDDQDALRIIRKVLEDDEIMHYEIVSIVRLDNIQTTTIIIETSTVNICLELDNNSGKVLSKEKLVA